MAERLLYDLAGAEDDRRFSPYCWRIKLALAHKGLNYTARPWRFTEKDAIAFAQSERVPVLVDGNHVVADSWSIACDLDARYSDLPALFDSEQARALARFFHGWADAAIGLPLLRVLVLDIFRHVHDKDRAYFRQSRERRLRQTLEDIDADKPKHLAEFRAHLVPLRLALTHAPFLSGETPAYADYIVFSMFMWARATSRTALLDGEEVIEAWRQRMLDLFDGLCRNAPGYD